MRTSQWQKTINAAGWNSFSEAYVRVVVVAGFISHLEFDSIFYVLLCSADSVGFTVCLFGCFKPTDL